MVDTAIPYEFALYAKDQQILTLFVSLPETLQTQLLDRFSSIVVEAQGVHTRHLDVLKSRVEAADMAAKALDPRQDQQVFIEYNVRQFSYPPDVEFETCSTYYDTVSLAFIDLTSPDD